METKGEKICHQAEEVRVQEVPGAAHRAAGPGAVHQEDGAVHRTAAVVVVRTAVLIRIEHSPVDFPAFGRQDRGAISRKTSRHISGRAR